MWRQSHKPLPDKNQTLKASPVFPIIYLDVPLYLSLCFLLLLAPSLIMLLIYASPLFSKVSTSLIIFLFSVLYPPALIPSACLVWLLKGMRAKGNAKAVVRMKTPPFLTPVARVDFLSTGRKQKMEFLFGRRLTSWALLIFMFLWG